MLYAGDLQEPLHVFVEVFQLPGFGLVVQNFEPLLGEEARGGILVFAVVNFDDLLIGVLRLAQRGGILHRERLPHHGDAEERLGLKNLVVRFPALLGDFLIPRPGVIESPWWLPSG